MLYLPDFNKFYMLELQATNTYFEIPPKNYYSKIIIGKLLKHSEII